MALQHLRSSTASKRPLPAGMSDGQLAINTNTASPGLFFKDSAGALIKVGPVHVGTTAPNASPASGGQTGNTVGEQWLDTAGGTYVFKVWDGSAWRSETGTFVDVNGDTMTGALGIIAGSASTPGLFFSGDANTGVYSPGADQLALSTSGVGRVFVDASGNVGVGTNAPQSEFVVSAGGGVGFEVDLDTGTSINHLIHYNRGSSAFISCRNNALEHRFETSSTERLRITSAGLVGVGTSTPSSLLNLAASNDGISAVSSANNRLRFTDTDTAVASNFQITGAIEFETKDASSPGVQAYIAGESSTTGFGNLLFGTGQGGSAATRMFIQSDGKVGIGSSSPVSALTVVGSAGSGDAGVQITSGSTTIGSKAALFFLPSTTPSFSTGSAIKSERLSPDGCDLQFFTVSSLGNSPVRAMTIDSSQRVGIGTTSPQDTFHLNTSSGSTTARISSATNTSGLQITARGDGTGCQIAAFGTSSDLRFFTTNSGGSTNEAVRIDSGQRLLVGTSSSSQGHLVVNNNSSTSSADGVVFIKSTQAGDSGLPGVFIVKTANDTTSAQKLIRFAHNNGGAGLGEIVGNGAGAAAFASYSDARLKENVTDLGPQLDSFMQLRPVEFDYKNDGGHQIGFIAQEMQSVYPDSVSCGDDSMLMLAGWSKTEARLVKALQEAVAKIESLEARLTAAGI